MDDSDEVEPGATSHMVCKIARCHFNFNDIHGADIKSINVKKLFLDLGQRVKPSHNPRVLLVMKHRLRGAGIYAAMTRFGFISTVCFSCETAMRNHLRGARCAFDVILVEWGMYPVSGYDLTTYIRQKYKDKVCVIGLVSGTTLAGDVLRGGADLFLRCPLMLHMRMLRKLLLPKSMTNPKFPLQLIRKPANFESMLNVLTVDKKAGDLSEVPLEPEADPEMNEKLLSTVIDYCRLHDPRNQDERWKHMMLNIFDAMTSAKQALINMTKEASTMREQAEYCRLFHPTTLPVSGEVDAEVERWSRRELELNYLLLKQRLNQQTEGIHDEVISLTRRDQDIQNLLEDMLRRRDEGSRVGSPSLDIVVSTKVEQTPEQKSIRERSLFKFCMSLSQRLENQLMAHEDSLVVRHARRLQEPVVLHFPWPPMLTYGNKKIYDGVRKMLDNIIRECNKLCIRVQGIAPAASSRIREFELGMVAAIPPDPTSLFNPPVDAPTAKTKKSAAPPTPVIKSSRIDQLQMQVRMETGWNRMAMSMEKMNKRTATASYFTRWLGFTIGKRSSRLLSTRESAEGHHSSFPPITVTRDIGTAEMPLGHGATISPFPQASDFDTISVVSSAIGDEKKKPQQQQSRRGTHLNDKNLMTPPRNSVSKGEKDSPRNSIEPRSPKAPPPAKGAPPRSMRAASEAAPPPPTSQLNIGQVATMRVSQPNSLSTSPTTQSLGSKSPKAGPNDMKIMLKQMIKDSAQGKAAVPLDGFVLTGGK